MRPTIDTCCYNTFGAHYSAWWWLAVAVFVIIVILVSTLLH